MSKTEQMFYSRHRPLCSPLLYGGRIKTPIFASYYSDTALKCLRKSPRQNAIISIKFLVIFCNNLRSQKVIFLQINIRA